jgi:protein TonB
VEPVYPDLKKGHLVSGSVELRAIIAVDGTVSSVRILKGPKSLMDAARTAVRQWRYAPLLVDGKPIEAVKDIDLVFEPPRYAF